MVTVIAIYLLCLYAGDFIQDLDTRDGLGNFMIVLTLLNFLTSVIDASVAVYLTIRQRYLKRQTEKKIKAMKSQARLQKQEERKKAKKRPGMRVADPLKGDVNDQPAPRQLEDTINPQLAVEPNSDSIHIDSNFNKNHTPDLLNRPVEKVDDYMTFREVVQADEQVMTIKAPLSS